MSFPPNSRVGLKWRSTQPVRENVPTAFRFNAFERQRFYHTLTVNADELIRKERHASFLKRIAREVLCLPDHEELPQLFRGLETLPFRYDSPQQFAQIGEVLLYDEIRQNIFDRYMSVVNHSYYAKKRIVQFKVFELDHVRQPRYNAATQLTLIRMVAFVSVEKILFTDKFDDDIPHKDLVVLLRRPADPDSGQDDDLNQVAVVLGSNRYKKRMTRSEMEQLLCDSTPKYREFNNAPVLFDQKEHPQLTDEFFFVEVDITFPGRLVLQQDDIIEIIPLTNIGCNLSKLKVLKRLHEIINMNTWSIFLNPRFEFFHCEVKSTPRHYEKIIKIFHEESNNSLELLLNEDQLCVLRAFGNNLQAGQCDLTARCLLIHGSPGTGKTCTVALAVTFCVLWYYFEELHRARESPLHFYDNKVLFAAPTQHSADEFVIKMNHLGLVAILQKYNRKTSTLEERFNNPLIMLGNTSKITKEALPFAADNLAYSLGYRTTHRHPRSSGPCYKEVFYYASIYVSTLHVFNYDSAFQDYIESEFMQSTLPEFRATFVDDCSRVSPFDLALAMTVNTRHVVLSGDHQQLRGIVRGQFNREVHSNRNMYDILEHLFPNDHLTFGVKLTKQYRMTAPIGHFPQHYFYSGRVVNMPTRSLLSIASLSIARSSMRSLLHFYLKGGVEVQITKPGRYYNSFKNTTEVAFTLQLMKACLSLLNFYDEESEHIDTKRMKDCKFSLGVITYYSAQKWVLTKFIHRNYPRWSGAIKENAICIETVDSTMGKEFSGVIQCFVRSGSDGKEVGFLDDPTRLNVGLTRAKYFNYLISDVGRFEVSKKARHFMKMHQESTQRRRLATVESFLKVNLSELVHVISKRSTSFAVNMEPGESKQVCVNVCSFRNNRDFYVIPIESVEELQKLERVSSSQLERPVIISPKEIYCTVVASGLYTGETINRIRILDGQSVDELTDPRAELRVRAIDHGTILYVERGNFYLCPEAFYSKPSFAIPCSMNYDFKTYWRVNKTETPNVATNRVFFLSGLPTSQHTKAMIAFEERPSSVEIVDVEALRQLIKSNIDDAFEFFFDFGELQRFTEAREGQESMELQLASLNRTMKLSHYICKQDAKLMALILNLTDYYLYFPESTLDHFSHKDIVVVRLCGKVFVRAVILETTADHFYKILAFDLGAIDIVSHCDIRRITSPFDITDMEPFKPNFF